MVHFPLPCWFSGGHSIWINPNWITALIPSRKIMKNGSFKNMGNFATQLSLTAVVDWHPPHTPKRFFYSTLCILLGEKVVKTILLSEAIITSLQSFSYLQVDVSPAESGGESWRKLKTYTCPTKSRRSSPQVFRILTFLSLHPWDHLLGLGCDTVDGQNPAPVDR